MRKLLHLLFFAAFLASCGKVTECPISDLANHDIAIYVCDADGNDLLDRSRPGAIPHENITVMFDGEEFGVGEAPPPTRSWVEQYRALFTKDTDEGVALVFGEFQPGDKYRNSGFTIDWGDGTTTDVAFRLYTTGSCSDEVVSRLWVDGVKQRYDISMTGSVIK